MSKKSKSVPPFVDVKARLKHQSLMQDFEELHQEVDAMRGHLIAAKHKKSMLAAEVRFLRRRYQRLMETKKMNSTAECLVDTRIRVKQINNTKEQLIHRNEAIRQLKLKKKQMNGSGEATSHGRKRVENEAKRRNLIPIAMPVLSANGTPSRNSIASFDLNQDGRPSVEEASLRRHPIFDLNEISTGEEDFHINEESKKSLMRAINDEQQNDLKLSICRNAGEGSTRGGKRKISWQDPVALRV